MLWALPPCAVASLFLGAGNHAPTVQVEVVGDSTVVASRGFTFESDVVVRVTVADPDGDRVSAQLRLGPVDLVMRPIVDEPSPAVREIRWTPWIEACGRQRIVVVAHDMVDPTVEVRGEARLDVVSGGALDAMTRLLDVDGDDFPEVVVADPNYDVAGVKNGGALLVFDAKQTPGPNGYAPVVLHAGSPVANGRVGDHGLRDNYLTAQTLQQVELSGDAYPDLIARSAQKGGSLHVWFGGPNSAADRGDDAHLIVANTPNFSDDGSQWLLFGDVTGDGQEDVVAVAPSESGPVPNCGAIHVWAGGATLRGKVLPTATLQLASPQPDDHLGGTNVPTSYSLAWAQCVTLRDVDGDGVLDVVAAAPFADRGGVADVGVVAVFKGGPTMTGNVAPLAELEPPPGARTIAQRLGLVEYSLGVHFGDLDADGYDDVIVPVRYTGAGGRVYVWKGGPTLSGSPAPLAKLKASAVQDRTIELGETFLEVEDFDGDGTDDLIAGNYVKVDGQDAAGALLLWRGRPGLAGLVDADATLARATPMANDFLGYPRAELVDVTGDGRRDLVVAGALVDDGVASDVGAILVWKGGVAYSGRPAATAELWPSPHNQGTTFGSFQVGELSGDGVLDLVVSSDDSPLRDSHWAPRGWSFLFHGGAEMSGSPAPAAFLRLPDTAWYSIPQRPADVTGDGIDDFFVLASFDLPSHPDAGALHLWAGGPGLVGVRDLDASCYGQTTDEQLGTDSATGGFNRTGDLVRAADVNGDGTLDLLIGAPNGAVGTKVLAGRGYVVEGGPSIAHGVMRPRLLTRAAPHTGDAVFTGGLSSPIQLGDLDRDGVLDWVVPTPDAVIGGHGGVGAVLWFPDAAPSANGGAVELTSGQNDTIHWFAR
jgi:hypothetical protein